MSVETLLSMGRLKSLKIDGSKVVVETKPSPQYHLYFAVVDKRLLKQKKASKVTVIDRVVPQDMLPEVLAEVAVALGELKKLQKENE